jgi:hypothetical protein
MAGEGAALGLGEVVAAEGARQIRVGLGSEREPARPQREGGGHQGRQEELEEGDHASAPT